MDNENEPKKEEYTGDAERRDPDLLPNDKGESGDLVSELLLSVRN